MARRTVEPPQRCEGEYNATGRSSTVDLLRHCESVYNATGDDVLDAPLSERGVQQAGTLEAEYDYVLVSPLRRARETLLCSRIRYTHVFVLPLLREHRQNVCDFLEGEDPAQLESEADVLTRRAILSALLLSPGSLYATGRLLLVGHADFFWHFTSHVVDDERFGMWLSPGERRAYTVEGVPPSK